MAENGAPAGVRLVLALGLVGLVGGALWYWRASHGVEQTDDAFVDGRAVTLAPRVAGTVISILAKDNGFVKRGQPILQLDPRDYQIALEQARGQAETAEGQYLAAQHALAVAQANFPARLAQAEADLREAQAARAKALADANRQRSLPRAASTQQSRDDAEAALATAEARLAAAQAARQAAQPVTASIAQNAAQVQQLDGARREKQAALHLAELNLERATLRAPQDGWFTKRAVEVGSYVQLGQGVGSLVSPEVWIIANFKEDQLARMHPGQSAEISIDAYPQLHLTGHVDSFQLGTGNKFTAFPPENATGNFVKIVQRLPVKIVIDQGLDPDQPLALGLSAVPRVSVE